MRQEEIIAAARGCVGARFRAQGRSISFGLDCVGVVAIAFGRAVPNDYPMRGGSAEAIAARIDAFGLVRVTEAQFADLVLIDAGLGQFHLAVLTGAGFVHADASLRKVVETPGRPAGIAAIWREQG